MVLANDEREAVFEGEQPHSRRNGRDSRAGVCCSARRQALDHTAKRYIKSGGAKFKVSGREVDTSPQPLSPIEAERGMKSRHLLPSHNAMTGRHGSFEFRVGRAQG